MIYLARHGQTPYNEEGRFQGWSDVPLTRLGERQATELAREVAAIEPGLLVTSSLERARQTALIVGSEIGLDPLVEPRFAETGNDLGNRVGGKAALPQALLDFTLAPRA